MELQQTTTQGPSSILGGSKKGVTMTDRDLQGYPRGWFVVAYSEEIAPGDVKPLSYFGTHLVLFRTEQGAVRVLDAFCAHLGAHLGVGGQVVGDCIQCPFHAWKFDGEGRCTEVPYAKKIPKKAFIKSWQVQEVNGLIFVIYSRDDREADYAIPDIEEHGAEEWTPWTTNDMEIKTHPKEIVENVADKGHFPIVHNTHVTDFENVYEGHMATQLTKGTAYPRGGGEDTFSLKATYYGPGYQVTEMDGIIKSRYFQAHTMIEENHLILRFGVSLNMNPSNKRAAKFAAQYAENLTIGFHEDIQIWENKLYRDRPVLCDGDGPIAKLRKWYRQFYTPTETEI